MKKSALSFEEYDYEKARKMLPEGYEPLPNIAIPFSDQFKLIKVPGFFSEDDAQARVKELNAQCPSNKYQIVPHQVQVTVSEYAIIMPESAKAFLRENEQIADSPIVTLTSYSPFLYRFLGKKEYEDSFFEKGELLISTFDRCKTAEVKDRRDKFENQNRFIITDGEYKTDTVLGIDFPSLLLCTSLSQESRQADGTPYEYGFKINNPDAFLDVLTRALVSKGVSVCEVVKGPCVYNNKLIELDASGTGITEDFLKDSKLGILNFSAPLEFIHNQAQIHMLMNKPTFFSHENEYRFVWKLARPIKREEVAEDVTVNDDGSIVVRVPELIAFCERL